MARRFVPFVVAAAAFAALAAAPAAAQDDPAVIREIRADLDRLRNNPFFAGQPDRVRDLVLKLLDRRSPTADAALREILLDPATHPNVAEQIARITLVAPPHALLADVVQRVHVGPPGSPLEKSLEGALLHADADVVRALADLSRDGARPAAYRLAAIRMLGGTGDAAALAPLVDLWGAPDRELSDAARAAFDSVAPGAAATVEEARAFTERLRREDLPLAEALRRILRERLRTSESSASGVTVRDYTELALSLLPRASLDEILRLYLLGSPVADVRAAAVRRLAAYPYDQDPDADARVRTARALFSALGHEDAAAVEEAMLATLASLAPSVRGGVGPDEMETLLARVRPGGGTARSTRLLATRLAGLLRDERAAPALEAAFEWYGGGDEDARIAILDALQDVPADRTDWLAARLAAETQPRVVRRLVVLVGRSQSPAALGALTSVLESRAADAETRAEAARSVATHWAVRSELPARDALLRALADASADPAVRVVAAGGLGIAGPGRDATVAGLLAAARGDSDAGVRGAAARSAIALDEPRVTSELMGRFADDPAVFDVWRDHFVDAAKRDQSAERTLAAADALVAAGQRPLAVRLVATAIDAVPEGQRVRSALRAAAAGMLLDEGRWEDAEREARALAATESRDDAARDRAELLLARALTASGESGRLSDAERRLVGLRTAGRLDRAGAAEASATLADCRLRRGDPIAAADALGDARADGGDLPARVRRRLEQVRADVDREVAAQRRRILALVDDLAGARAAAARTELAAPATAGVAAWHLARELSQASDVATARRLFAAAAVVTGSAAPELADGATAAEVGDAAAAVRAALAKVPRAAAPSR